MSSAKGRRSEAGSSGATLTLEDLDAAIGALYRHGRYQRRDMLWDLGVGPSLHTADNDSSRLIVSQMVINRVIEDIGEDVGLAADGLVKGTLRPIQEAPHLDPGLVWNISRAFWHEIVHRGMEIGRVDAYWIKGLNDFSYDEVLVFVQHIWLAFKQYTGLDFTVPEQSKTIKTWLSLSPRLTQREQAPDAPVTPTGHREQTPQERIDRLQHYIDHGGPSAKLEKGESLDGGVTVGYDGPTMADWQYDVRDD